MNPAPSDTMLHPVLSLSATYCDKFEMFVAADSARRPQPRRDYPHDGGQPSPSPQFSSAPAAHTHTGRATDWEEWGRADDIETDDPGVAPPPYPGFSPRRHAQRADMAAKTHAFVSIWFAVTIPIIFWDAMYCFMRPRSMRGGDLHWIWGPYSLYQDVDYVYGLEAFNSGDGFPNAQSLLNVVENFLNIFYLYLAHVSGSPAAPVVGFASATMTLSKTALYWLQEAYCGWCSIGHNTLKDLIVLWIIPNGLWLLVPSLIIWRLGKDMNEALYAVDKANKKTASGKKH